MKAVILAAGIGSRLRPMTNDMPKSMVQVAGIPIIRHQVNAYKRSGVTEIIIVIGYCGDKIVSHFLHEKDVQIIFVKNIDYENTNNMYSLYLSRHEIAGSAFYLSNADVVFEASILDIYTGIESCIFVDKTQYNVESMKVVTDGENRIQTIAKTIDESTYSALSIDVYKFDVEDGYILLSHVTDIIEKGSNLTNWTEVALKELFEEKRFNPLAIDIHDKKWVEIDNYDDLTIADKKFSVFDFTLASYDTLVFDLDGTLFLGDVPIESAIQQVNTLLRTDKKIYFITNNSSKTKWQYVEKLSQMGLFITVENIISSIDSLLYFLQANAVTDAFMLGTKQVCDYIQSCGINPISDNPEYVVVAYDTELDYKKLVMACELINSGVEFVATHEDMFCPTPQGPIPDCGAMTCLIEHTTSKKVKHVFGKPNANVFNHIKMNPTKTVIIGDRLHTDGMLAKNVGADYILVLSGETTRDMIEGNVHIPIHLCLKDFGELDFV